jgi:FG-GAP-like repeat
VGVLARSGQANPAELKSGTKLLQFTDGAGPPRNSQPHGITAGPDGALWFTEGNGDKIGRFFCVVQVDSGECAPPREFPGLLFEYPIPTSGAVPNFITTGPDNALWFTEGAGNNIGRITTCNVLVDSHDFNHDCYSDILWRDNSGNMAIWEMYGTSILNSSATYVATVPPSSTWSIVGTGDYNGDGKSDILWRDTAGDVAIWEMNGTSILNSSTTYVATVPPSTWTIQSQNSE